MTAWNDDTSGMYNFNSQTKFKTTILSQVHAITAYLWMKLQRLLEDQQQLIKQQNIYIKEIKKQHLTTVHHSLTA